MRFLLGFQPIPSQVSIQCFYRLGFYRLGFYRLVLLLVIVAGLGLSMSALASSRVLRQSLEQHTAKQWGRADVSGLKKVTFDLADIEVNTRDGQHYLTRLFAAYETDTVEQLKDYVFVNFIRGEQYASSGDGLKQFIFMRQFFGKDVEFRHKEWVVDSVDADPVYNSSDPKNRHALYRWNRVRGSFDKSSEVFVGRELPQVPEVYVADRPGTAFYFPETGIAKNIDLEFQMCLFRSNEVPLQASSNWNISNGSHWVQPEPAISCFPWKSRFIYNHEQGRFEY